MELSKSDDVAAAEKQQLVARLKAAIEASGGPAAVSRRASISESTLYKWLSGTEPGVLNLKKLAQVTSTSLDYLVGQVPHPASFEIEPRSSDLISNVFNLKPSDFEEGASAPEGFVIIPKLDIRASAGPGRAVAPFEEQASSEFAIRESWLRALGVSPRNAEFLIAKGDSMEDTIKDGDLLLNDRGITSIEQDGIHVLVNEGLVMIKRLQQLVDGSLRVISDNNRRYPPELIRAEALLNVHIVGRIRWYGRAI